MILQIFLLVLGFLILIKGADIMVDGASSFALKLKISKVLIGLTIVAIGTSAPELAISIKSLMINSTDMLIGNVMGSNITNILLILGIACVISPINIKSDTIKKEIPLCMLVSTLLVVLFLDMKLSGDSINIFSRSDAIAVMLFFGIFIYYIINLAKEKKNLKAEKAKYGYVKSIILIIFGLVGIVVGSNLVVDSATFIATKLGLSQRVIALTVVAFGTSLPELTTTIVSSLKKEEDILVGNIIGSNIINICLVLALPIIIFGNVTPTSFNIIDNIMLVGSSILLYIIAFSNKKITRVEGVLMLLCFVLYYILVFIY